MRCVAERRGLVRAAASLGGGTALGIEAGSSAPLVRQRFIITSPKETVREAPVPTPMAPPRARHSF